MPIDKYNRNSYIYGMDAKSLVNKLLNSGLTQVQIADFVGCKQPTVSDIRHGKIRNPSSRIAFSLVNLAIQRQINIGEIYQLPKVSITQPSKKTTEPEVIR